MLSAGRDLLRVALRHHEVRPDPGRQVNLSAPPQMRAFRKPDVQLEIIESCLLGGTFVELFAVRGRVSNVRRSGQRADLEDLRQSLAGGHGVGGVTIGNRSPGNMSINPDNRRRAFADVVTVEAWHDAFGKGSSKVDLHADVVFGTARLGAEVDSPIRFRLSVKRAELLIIIPELEPVAIDARSVSRDTPRFEGSVTETVELARGANAKVGAQGALDLAGGRAFLSSEATAQVSKRKTRKLELKSKVALMMVTQSRSPEGYYRWLVESSDGGLLDGRPWDAAKQPRLQLIDRRSNPSKGIPPTVRVEVRCRREDLMVSDLQTKDEGLWESVKSRIGHRNRIAAAISYIRNRLSEENLEVENMEDVFGQLTLGSALAQSS
jgi:hypothetical protein